MGNSLAVQWLGLHASTAGGMSLIPGWGTKIRHAAWCSQKKKERAIMISKETLENKTYRLFLNIKLTTWI